MIAIVLLVVLASIPAWCGSPCPSRNLIYPCTCVNLRVGKSRNTTVVTCTGLEHSSNLEAIFPVLQTLDIEHFYLYDSFWRNEETGGSLPTDWLSLMKVKTMEIVDTLLSRCFACNWRMDCQNSETTRIALTNSSSHDKMCILCDSVRNTRLPWIGCTSELREFQFTHGKLKTLNVDIFPVPMQKLTVLNLAFNQIVKVDGSALKNLPKLKSLDLSHNAIEHFDHIFTHPLSGSDLEYLHLGWNFIKTVDGQLFSNLPKLKVIRLNNNGIVSLNERAWRRLPEKLRNIHLKENPIHCDCNIRWINRTLDVGLNFEAACGTPEEYRDSAIRRASRAMIERCNAAGEVRARPHSGR